MTFMTRLAAVLLALLAWSPAQAQEAETQAPPACGTRPITIARMQWPTAALLAEIHARILAAELDCTVQVIPGDLATTASSMSTTGQPAVAPEMWITRVPEIWNAAIAAQTVRPAAPSFDIETFEGWFIPAYLAEAVPELTSVTALAANYQIFAGQEIKGRLLSCPIDWGCAVINRNLLAAHGLTNMFEVVEPANRFELDTLIAEAVSRREPVLFYYWQPNAILAQFDFRPLDMGAFNGEAFTCLGRRGCSAPQPSSFAPEQAVAALAEWVFAEAPGLARYFQRATMPVAAMNAMLLALSEPGATVESVAERFVADEAEIWRPWLGDQ